jgi:hypothetical protein
MKFAFEKIKEKIAKWMENNKKESSRDLDSFDEDLLYFLKLIFVKREITENDLNKKQRLSDKDKFEDLTDFALTRRYVDWSKEKGGVYTITNRGIEYLLSAKEIKEEEKKSNVIKWATIVLAISAFFQIVDIWMYRPLTQKSLILLVMGIIGGVLTLIKQLIPFAIIIFVLFIIFKINKKLQNKNNHYLNSAK